MAKQGKGAWCNLGKKIPQIKENEISYFKIPLRHRRLCTYTWGLCTYSNGLCA